MIFFHKIQYVEDYDNVNTIKNTKFYNLYDYVSFGANHSIEARIHSKLRNLAFS